MHVFFMTAMCRPFPWTMRLGAVVIRMAPNVAFCRFWFVLAPIIDAKPTKVKQKSTLKSAGPSLEVPPSCEWFAYPCILQPTGCRCVASEKNHCHPLGGRVARKSSSFASFYPLLSSSSSSLITVTTSGRLCHHHDYRDAYQQQYPYQREIGSFSLDILYCSPRFNWVLVLAPVPLAFYGGPPALDLCSHCF